MTLDMNMLRISRDRTLPLLAVLCLTLGGCDQPVNTPVASQNLQGITADDVIYGMTSYVTAAGIRQGQVKADTAYMYNDSSVVRLHGMHVVFYGDDGQERATVTADRGAIFQNNERMEARGRVVLTIPADGRRITSSELNYDPDRDQIWSDSATVMVQGSDTTRGTSFRSDLDFKNVQIQNPRGAVGGDVF